MSARQDIQRQGPIEAQIAKWESIRQGGGYIEFNPDGYAPGWDFIHYSPFPEFRPTKYEVKYDEESALSKNLFFEFHNCKLNLPSGLAATKADLYVHIAPPSRIFIYKPNLMLEYLSFLSKKYPNLCQIKYNSGDDNGYEKSTDEAIESQLCQNHPASCGANSLRASETRRLHFTDIVRGTRVLLNHKLAGSPLVSRQQAEQRASICATCKKNVSFTKPCSGYCPELDDLVKALVGDVSTPYDSQLKSCAVCACSNIAQVHVPAEFLALGVTEAMMVEFEQVPDCWKAQELRELKGAPA